MDGARYIIAGGSGLIGQALARSLSGSTAELIILTRSPGTYRGPGGAVEWDGQTLGDWRHQLEGAAGVINLTGRNISTRWTTQARREILDSRVNSAGVIAQAIDRCTVPPAVWVNASAVGIFGDRGDEILDETAAPAPPGEDFLGDVCRAWELAVNAPHVPTRKVILRFGVVFGNNDPALGMLVRVTKLFAGGRLGSGGQWMPWIHVDDAVRAIRWALENDQATGTLNTTSPNPVTNAQLMRELRRVLRRPPAPPAPAWAARLAGKVLGLPVESALASTRAVPRRLTELGFGFAHPELREALEHLLGVPRP